jgi:hypothetical protein
MHDDLADEIKTMVRVCEEISLALVPGSFEPEKMPVVHWTGTGSSDWKVFLTLAKSLNSSFVILQEYEFEEAAIEALRPEGIEAMSEDELEGSQKAENEFDFEGKWNEMKTKRQQFYGLLYSFSLYWFKDGICFAYEKDTEWYRKLVDDVDTLAEKVEAAESEGEEEEPPELTDEEVEQTASTLARDEFFQKATNQGARRYALKKRFPQIFEKYEHQVTEIINQAKGIFELEVEPELEKALDAKILAHAKEGLTKDEIAKIAKKLAIPVARVKRVL